MTWAFLAACGIVAATGDGILKLGDTVLLTLLGSAVIHDTLMFRMGHPAWTRWLAV